MSTCEIHIINLPESTDRRENIASQLNALDLEYHLFAAVNGKKQRHPLFDRYSEKKRSVLKGKTLVGGQLGCYASHYLLWEKCAASDKPFIVLEDDARLSGPQFLEFYKNIPQLDPRYECIRLFHNPAKQTTAIKTSQLGALQIFKYTKGYMGTIGYYLTPAGAKKFLQNSETWFLTVDIYMDRFWSNKVEYYGIRPACLDFDPKFASDIDYTTGKQKYTPLIRIRRELFTTLETIRRLMWNIIFRTRKLFS